MNRNNYTALYSYDAAGTKHKTTYRPSGMPFTWRGEQHVTEQLISIIARDINLYTTTIDLHGVYGVLMV